MANRPCIWLTRPAEDSASLAALLAEHQIDSIVAPVMQIAQTPFALNTAQAPNAILVTSRHACYALGTLPETWRSLPLFCVGEATAETAQHYGFTNPIAGVGDVLSLLPLLLAHLTKGATLLYLAGTEIKVDIAPLLGAKGIAVTRLTTYEAVAQTILAPEVTAALEAQSLTGVAFFSPRSAAITTQLITADRHALVRHTDAYCLSLAIAEAAATLPWRSIHACSSPTRAAMVDLIVSRSHLAML